MIVPVDRRSLDAAAMIDAAHYVARRAWRRSSDPASLVAVAPPGTTPLPVQKPQLEPLRLAVRRRA